LFNHMIIDWSVCIPTWTAPQTVSPLVHKYNKKNMMSLSGAQQ
jgi:hypothetical protein